MYCHSFHRAGVCFGILVLILPTRSVHAADPPRQPPPEELSLRAFQAGRIAASAFLFGGAHFPSLTFEPASAAEQFLGRHDVDITFYDLSKDWTTEPKMPGPYGAEMVFKPDHGRSTRRLVTLYHTASEPPFAQRFDVAHLENIARWTGLPVSRLLHNRTLLASTCQGQPLALLAQNPGAARIFAGIARMPAELQPARQNEDAFVWERQWWVDLKRQISHSDKQWAGPFNCPRPVAGASATIIHAGSAADAGMQPDAATKIDAVCQQWAADSDQGFAVCIVRHGVVVLHKAYGMRDGHAMTLADKSWMASVTKCFSATCMMMLVDQGLVSLDDPVTKFVPQLEGIPVRKPLLIRHLYTHTSGLAVWPPWGDETPDVEDEVAECLPMLHVGEKWEYGGQGNTLGCKIIESITGEALPLFYLHHVLKPLGMDHTDVLGAHADMQTVPLDLARFGQMLLNRGRYRNLEFMRPEAFLQMLPQKLTGILGPNATKSFGISMDGEPGSGKFGHGAASAATFSVEANNDLVVIMCRNKAGKNWDKYNGQFWDAIHAGIIKEQAPL